MQEFGRTPRCICNVLAVLSDGEESMQATFRAAVELAQNANARLTLVKTCERGRSYVWVAPFAVGSAYMPPDVGSPEEAAQALSRLAEEVPDSISVTTLVLTEDTQAALLGLLAKGHFGAVVTERGLLSGCRRVRRLLRNEQVFTVLVDCDREEENALADGARILSGGLTRDGAVEAETVSAGRSRRLGLWPWNGRRLAGRRRALNKAPLGS